MKILKHNDNENFLQVFCEFRLDENHNDTKEEATEELGTDEDDCSDKETEVEFVDVDTIMAEDDSLQYQLPKHHQCALLLQSQLRSAASFNWYSHVKQDGTLYIVFGCGVHFENPQSISKEP